MKLRDQSWWSKRGKKSRCWDKSGSSDHWKQWQDKGNILEIEPIEVAEELNEWVVIQKKRQNEDNICIWASIIRC